jgi:hypothetical protein
VGPHGSDDGFELVANYRSRAAALPAHCLSRSGSIRVNITPKDSFLPRAENTQLYGGGHRCCVRENLEEASRAPGFFVDRLALRLVDRLFIALQVFSLPLGCWEFPGPKSLRPIEVNPQKTANFLAKRAVGL